MEPPQRERELRPANRSGRILGLLAAVGFSIAMWAFLAVAVLGLILKVVGPHRAEEGLAAAGIYLPQGFDVDSNGTGADSENDLSGTPGTAPSAITTLDGQPLDAAGAKPPETGKPPQAPAKSAPGK